MRRVMVLLLAVLMLLSGCMRPDQIMPQGDPYELFFLAKDLKTVPGDGALQAETAYLTIGEGMNTRDLAEFLMEELLKGPLSEELKSPIPLGTTLESLEIHGSQAKVDMSAAYGSLSGIGLTLADYAITMTLTQLPDIMSVRITVGGRELAYRDRQVFSTQGVLLAPQGDVVSTVEAILYFQDKKGGLIGEEWNLELYEGDTQVIAVTRALESGPKDKELRGVMPEGFRVKSVWLEEDTCYVNLSSALLTNLPDDRQLSRALMSLSFSICSLEAVREVRFLVDGEYQQNYGPVNIAKPYIE